MWTSEELERMSRMSITSMEKSELADLMDVKIDASLPLEERREQFCQQIKNPYCFKCGKLAVQLIFDPDGPPFEQLIADYLRRKAQG